MNVVRYVSLHAPLHIGLSFEACTLCFQAGVQRPRLTALFRGISTPVATAGLVHSLNLGLYENFRRALCPESANDSTLAPKWAVGTAAAVSGVCVSPLTCPLSRLKVRITCTSGPDAIGTSPLAPLSVHEAVPLFVYMHTDG